jgi:hypothetical protein
MRRERSEWAQIWWEHADDPSTPRVLLVGDSISNGYRRWVQERLMGRFHVDLLATSKAIDDPGFFRELGYMLGDYRYEAVHFNNGLHGEHLDAEGYAKGMRRAVWAIRAKCPRVVVASSTPLTVPGDEGRLREDGNAQVLERNAVVREIATSRQLVYDDLYALALGKPEWRSGDGCHFNAAGYEALGAAASAAILETLEKGKKR